MSNELLCKMMIVYLVAMSCLLVLVEVAQGQKCGCSPPTFRSAASAEEIEKQVKQNGSVLVGDVMMTAEDLQFFKGSSKFRASLEAKRRWPRGEVFYEMSSMSPSSQQMIRQALMLISRHVGCVRFTEVPPGHTGPHVNVYSGDSCYSYIGRRGTKQPLSLGPACVNFGTITHEFMHALGFDHEHARKDRDDFVSINWGAIQSSKCDAFAKCMDCTITTPYDIDSVMQYPSDAFSCGNGQKTMLTTSRQEIPVKLQLSKYDVKKIKNYYCSKNR